MGSDAAGATACSVDYVAMPLLALASVLIGHARWVRATQGWVEPPHLCLGVVGDSGSGKSPGADCLLGEVVPEIERRMLDDFPDRLQTWCGEDGTSPPPVLISAKAFETASRLVAQYFIPWPRGFMAFEHKSYNALPLMRNAPAD